MMTNSYLIRARTIRDTALQDADRREGIAQAGQRGRSVPIWTAVFRALRRLLWWRVESESGRRSGIRYLTAAHVRGRG
jgi:hypothetical protein